CDVGTVHLQCDTAMKQVNRDDKQTTAVIRLHEYAPGVGQGSAENPNGISSLQVRIWAARQRALYGQAYTLDLLVVNAGQAIPARTQNGDNTFGLADIQILVSANRVAYEQITSEHRHPTCLSATFIPAPVDHCGQKDFIAFAEQLLLHHCFAVAARPDDMPGRLRGGIIVKIEIGTCKHAGFCGTNVCRYLIQGFAPSPVVGTFILFFWQQ